MPLLPLLSPPLLHCVTFISTRILPILSFPSSPSSPSSMVLHKCPVHGCTAWSSTCPKMYLLPPTDVFTLRLNDAVNTLFHNRICKQCWDRHNKHELPLHGRIRHVPGAGRRRVLRAPPPPPPSPPPPPPPVRPAPVRPLPPPVSDDGDTSGLCAYCLTAPPRVVWQPCLHQQCCAECWEKTKARQLSVFRKQQKVEYQHTYDVDAKKRRTPFVSHCPVCRTPVGHELTTFMC